MSIQVKTFYLIFIILFANVALAKDMQYSIPMKDCPITFMAPAGGQANLSDADSRNPDYHRDNNRGSYRAPIPYRKGKLKLDFSVTFTCDPRPVDIVCKEIGWPRVVNGAWIGGGKEFEKDSLSWIKPTFNEIKGNGWTGAVISTLITGAPSPRPRSVAFCLGNSKRTLWGGTNSDIGYDKDNILVEFIKLLRSVELTEQKTSAQSGDGVSRPLP